jgi:biopolymer transport protein ExbD
VQIFPYIIRTYANNSCIADFSTGDKSGGNVVPVVVVLVVVLAFVAAAVMLLRAQIMTSS